MARDAGITHAERISVPLGVPWLAPTAVLRALSRYRLLHAIHAWSYTSLSAATVFRPRVPRTLTVCVPPAESEAKRYLRLMLHAGFDVETPTLAIRNQLKQSGLPGGRIRHVPATLDFSRLAIDQRELNRQRWGIQGDTRVVALLDNASRQASAREAANVAYLVQAGAQRSVRLLVHPKQFQRAEMQQVLEGLGNPNIMIQDPVLATPWAVLPSVDAALLLDRDAPLATMWAMASEVPVVAPDTPANRELLEPYPHAAYAPSARGKQLAHTLQQDAFGWPEVRRDKPYTEPAASG